jgi:hypothetical protein
MATKANERKFCELILYVARKSEGDLKFGATKLNKVLFYADFWAHAKLGRSISGQRYRRLDQGPAPRHLMQAVARLERESACAWAERDYYGRAQRRLVALREPDLSGFSGEEISIADEVIDALWDLNASEVSDLSHRFIGWQLAEEGEEIPYSTTLLGSPRPPTPAEVEYGHRLAREPRG